MNVAATLRPPVPVCASNPATPRAAHECWWRARPGGGGGEGRRVWKGVITGSHAKISNFFKFSKL